jgi:ubiquinone/menaquinone biosynthesis C-methylase UbiE
MPTEREIYAFHAGQYERLIQCEDYQGNLLPVIQKIRPLTGLDVVDLGAGTGRLSRLLAPYVHTVQAFDTSAHMLAVAAASLQKLGLSNWYVCAADHRRLPIRGASVDLALAGWSFCYLAVWGGSGWRSALETGLAEVKRILRPGGTFLLLETLGTGYESPHPPPHLDGYYAWLKEKGFQSTWVRTDYHFESLEEAGDLATFFFGEQMGREVRHNQWEVLPECTGLWWLQPKIELSLI